MQRLIPVWLLYINLFFGCVKSFYFIADPYWSTATGVSFLQIRTMALLEGYLVNIVQPNKETPWFLEEDIGQSELSDISSLKPRIEYWLKQNKKVIMSPYWLRNIESQPLEFIQGQGQLVLIDAISRDPKIQSVSTDMESGYYEVGRTAGAFMKEHPERQQAIAIFYRGSSYDRYYESFTAGFQAENPSIDKLVSQRYYAAEINDINILVDEIDSSSSLIILGLAHLSDFVYRILAIEERSLFMVENFGLQDDLGKKILLSLDSDYKNLIQAAIRLPANNSDISNQVSQGSQAANIVLQPYVLNLPNPELLSNIEPVKELVSQKLEEQIRQYNSIPRRSQRAWERFTDFLIDFRPSDINWFKRLWELISNSLS